MNSPLKSRASQKFRANHPSQHQMFVNLVKGAKQTKSKFLFQREEDEINNELSNMVKNQQAAQFRLGDLTCDRLKKRSKHVKRVSWRKSLCEVRAISEILADNLPCVPGTNMPQQTCIKQSEMWPNNCDGNMPDILQQTWSIPNPKFAVNVPDLLEQKSGIKSSDTGSMLKEKWCTSLPDIVRQTMSETAGRDESVPDLLQLTPTPPSQGSPSSQDNLGESSSPEVADEYSRKQEGGCLKLSFFMDCDPHLNRQR